MKIRTMFTFALVFFSISSIIAYAIYSSSTINAVAKQQFEALYSNIAANEAKSISQYVKNLSAEASLVGTDELLRTFDPTNVQYSSEAAAHAETFINTKTGILRIVVYNKTGAQISTALGENKYTKYKPFTEEQLAQMETGCAYFGTILNENGRESDYELASPYVLDDRIIMVYFPKDQFDKIVKAGSFPVSGRTTFMDPLGRFVDNNNNAGFYMGSIDEITAKSGYAEYKLIKSASENSSLLSKTQYYPVSNDRRLLYTVQATGYEWYVTTFADESKAFVYSSSASSKVIGLVIGLSVFFTAFYIITIMLVVKPLKKIEVTLTKIHKGDHDSRIQVKSKNEYGDIAESFNMLLDNVVTSEKRYRTIVEMSDDIIFEWNLKSNNVTLSNNFNKKFSYRAASDHFSDSFFIKGKVHPEDAQRYRQDMERLQKGEEFKGNTYRWKNVYGDYIWMSMKTSSIHDKEGGLVKIIGILSDIDREKRGEMQLKQQASYDALTGVYNRETIENVINAEIQKVADGGDGFALLFVDIDDFKVYNDKYSHATGDQVLQFVTKSIGEIIDDFGFIGRYGGDEFLVCVRNCSTNIPANIAKEILARLKEGFVSDTDDKLTVSVSIGVYPVKNSEKTVEEIIAIADEAMYGIKKNGKSSFGIVNDESELH